MNRTKTRPSQIGYYQVSDFAHAVSNSSDLCPPPITIPNCEFDLEGGESSIGFAPDERDLSGMLNVDTRASTTTMLLHAEWKPVQEREQVGQTVQVIEGTLNAGRDLFVAYPDYQSAIPCPVHAAISLGSSFAMKTPLPSA